MTYWVEMKWLKQEGGERGEPQKNSKEKIQLIFYWQLITQKKKLFRFMRARESGIFVARSREEAKEEKCRDVSRRRKGNRYIWIIPIFSSFSFPFVSVIFSCRRKGKRFKRSLISAMCRCKVIVVALSQRIYIIYTHRLAVFSSLFSLLLSKYGNSIPIEVKNSMRSGGIATYATRSCKNSIILASFSSFSFVRLFVLMDFRRKTLKMFICTHYNLLRMYYTHTYSRNAT